MLGCSFINTKFGAKDTWWDISWAAASSVCEAQHVLLLLALKKQNLWISRSPVAMRHTARALSLQHSESRSQ